MFRRKIILLTLACTFFLSAQARSSSLPTASPTLTTCRPDIQVAIETRAWLEAQREITNNQNVIMKPDSVLEYSCFDRYLNALARHAQDMASENISAWTEMPRVVSSPGPDDTGLSITHDPDRAGTKTGDMGNALTELAGIPLQEYNKANFGDKNSFLGGRGSVDYMIEIPINGADYTCDRMDAVWKHINCMNFSTRAEDGFLTFEQLKAHDPRDLPEACAAPDARYENYIKEAFKEPKWRTTNASGDPLNTIIEKAYTTRSEYTDPGNCDDTRALKTGITIYNTAPSAPFAKWPDAVCFNPGCFAVPTSTTTFKCQKIN